MTATIEPQLLGSAPPPIRHDRMTQSWALAATVSWCGDCVFDVALAWTAVHTVSGTLAGVVVAAAMLPQGLLMLLGGVLADRHDTRRIMIGGELARIGILIAGAATWASGDQSLAVLVGVGLGFGTVSGLTNPARATLLRQLVRGDDLGTAIGWTQLGTRLATLAGAPIGALVITGFGLVTAMAADATTFALVATLLITGIRPRYCLPRAPTKPLRASLGEIIRYVRRAPTARLLVIGLLAPNLFVGPATDLGLPLRIASAHWAAAWLGASNAVLALAAIAGSVAAMKWRGSDERVLVRTFTALTGQGVGIVLLGVPDRATVIAGALVIGATAGLASVWASTAFQRSVEPGLLGRMSSLVQLGDLLLLTLVTPLYGALAGVTSLAAAAALFGAAMSATNLVITRTSKQNR